MAEDEELPESVESVEPQDAGERTPDINEQLPEGVESVEPENATEETPDINEQLLTAAKDGEVDEIKRCLAEGADINARSSIGMTSLYRAVFWNRDDVVAYLLTEAKPNLEIKDDDGESPLWRAVAERNENNVKILLEKGADVNVTDSQGVSTLFRAVDENVTSIVRLVLGGNPDVNAKNDSRETPLLRACTNSSDEIAELLIGAGAKIGAFDNEGDSELCQAAYRGNSELAKLLLRHGADIGSANEVGMTPFLWAAERGNAEVGQVLLDAGADMGAAENDGYTALHWCASFGHIEFTEMLLKNHNQASGADELPSAPSAPGAGSVETKPKIPPKLPVTKLDIEAKNKVGETALHVASANGRTEIVALLIGRANFAARDGLEWTALHHGAYYGQTETVQLLLTKIKPATLTAKNIDGNTVLHFASRAGKEDLVNILLKEFENASQGLFRNTITEKNYDGQTALSIATDEAQKGTVQLLVNAEADVFYVASEDGSTAQGWPKMERTNPKQVEAISLLLTANEEQWKDIDESVKQTLHWACRTGDRDLVKKILKLPDVEDKDVLYWAAVGGQTKIVQFLLDKYTKNNPDAIKSGKFGPRAVLEAARNGHGPVVKQILRSMMELSDVKFETDTTEAATKTWFPLHWAVNYKAREPEQAVEVVRHLLMNGANPETIMVDAEGRTSDSAMELARRLKDSSEFKDEFKTAIVSLLETPLRLPRKPLQLVEPTLGPGGVQNVCKQFSANIIDFYPSDGRFDTLERKTSVYDIIYKEGPHSMMSDARENWKIKLRHRFRWIHLPANNVSQQLHHLH
jgi:ankyrin repeat protein